jgi:hypothetical protein
MIGKAWGWLFGPGYLGGTVALAVAGLFLGWHVLAVAPVMDEGYCWWVVMVLWCSYIGGMFGGGMSHDGLLRAELTGHRRYVGLTGGAVGGAIFALPACNVALLLVVSLAGGVGGLVDAAAYPGHVEEDD